MGYPLSIDLRVRILAADRLLLSDPGSILEQLDTRINPVSVVEFVIH